MVPWSLSTPKKWSRLSASSSLELTTPMSYLEEAGAAVNYDVATIIALPRKRNVPRVVADDPEL